MCSRAGQALMCGYLDRSDINVNATVVSRAKDTTESAVCQFTGLMAQFAHGVRYDSRGGVAEIAPPGGSASQMAVTTAQLHTTGGRRCSPETAQVAEDEPGAS